MSREFQLCIYPQRFPEFGCNNLVNLAVTEVPTDGKLSVHSRHDEIVKQNHVFDRTGFSGVILFDSFEQVVFSSRFDEFLWENPYPEGSWHRDSLDYEDEHEAWRVSQDIEGQLFDVWLGIVKEVMTKLMDEMDDTEFQVSEVWYHC